MTKIALRMNQILAEQQGAVAVIVAIVMFLLVGFAAFAVDFGYTYGVKNKLQNAADAAALAGASVLFSNNQLCLSSGSPFSCCNGDHTGSCNPGVVDVQNVEDTAQALADMNHSGGDDTTVTVEIGHYAFAPIWGAFGSFTEAVSNVQMIGWQPMSFSVLNDRTDFINAVRVTVTRGDVPRFFSRIWSSDDLGVSAQAIAYIGFAGTLAPGEVDEPIAICNQSISDSNGLKCNVGTMLNNNTQTARWTDFTQGEQCGTANTSGTRPLICDGNPNPINLGEGISTTNGTVGSEMRDIYNCWKNTGKFDSDGDGVPDTNLDTTGPEGTPDGKPDHPWQLLLPVIDCTGQGCLTTVGAVVVNVVWINNQNSDGLDKADPWIPNYMYNPLTHSMWSCSGSATTCWNDFQQNFNLQNNNLTGPAQWEQKALYFLPDCEVHVPAGGTGGQNLGIQAQRPVLVK